MKESLIEKEETELWCIFPIRDVSFLKCLVSDMYVMWWNDAILIWGLWFTLCQSSPACPTHSYDLLVVGFAPSLGNHRIKCYYSDSCQSACWWSCQRMLTMPRVRAGVRCLPDVGLHVCGFEWNLYLNLLLLDVIVFSHDSHPHRLSFLLALHKTFSSLPSLALAPHASSVPILVTSNSSVHLECGNGCQKHVLQPNLGKHHYRC